MLRFRLPHFSDRENLIVGYYRHLLGLHILRLPWIDDLYEASTSVRVELACRTARLSQVVFHFTLQTSLVDTDLWTSDVSMLLRAEVDEPTEQPHLQRQGLVPVSFG